NVTEGVREIISRPCPTCDGDGVIKSEETIAIEFERRLRVLTKKAPKKHEAFLVQMNPRVSAQFTGNGKRVLHALEEETGRRFHFQGSEGLPLNHFDILMEGSKDEVMERAVPFREGDEVLVHIVEPHMYDVDDAVAKIDGYIISVSGGGRYVGNKRLVRIEHAGRTSATATLLDEPEGAEPAPAAPAAPKPAPRTRAPRRRTPVAAVAAAAESESGESGEGPVAATASSDDEAPALDAADAAAQNPAEGEEVESTPRRRGRRGGRRRSRATAEPAAAEPSSSES
ncbi:MAG: ribonuclease, partial [bacterium]